MSNSLDADLAEVIRFEYSLKLKIKRSDWLLADWCPQAAIIIALYFEFENELKFYIPGAWEWTVVSGLHDRIQTDREGIILR